MNLDKENLFIFMGRISTPGNWNSREVLTTFDELLPLYEFVESDGSSSLKPHRYGEDSFSFKAGCPTKKSTATGERNPGISNIWLRHNDMQDALHEKLASKYGEDKVGTEIPGGNGVRIDLVVEEKEDAYSFYEIKTAHEPRICIREAIGQLLEYAYWGGSDLELNNLVVVGPNPIDNHARKYLSKLKASFNLPIKYDHLRLQV